MNYKYVIGGSSTDFYVASYSDVMNDYAIEYHKYPVEKVNPILKFLWSKHFSPKINNVVNLPFKSIWNPVTLKHGFDKNDNICFMLFSNYTSYIDLNLYSYWRKKYPNCKIVMFFQDLAEKNKYKQVENLKNYFDLILSFDQHDCEKYGWIYYPLVYSKVDVADDPDISESDIFFVGKAKDRLNEILEIFKKCEDAGLNADFHIVGVPEDKQLYKDRINYCSQMPYPENLKRIKKTKCMLEIMQQGGHGYTLRYCEAIAMGKRLITNNPEIITAPFYNKDFISVFNSGDEFDVDFVVNGPKNVDYRFLYNLSPRKLLEYIDGKL